MANPLVPIRYTTAGSQSAIWPARQRMYNSPTVQVPMRAVEQRTARGRPRNCRASFATQRLECRPVGIDQTFAPYQFRFAYFCQGRLALRRIVRCEVGQKGIVYAWPPFWWVRKRKHHFVVKKIMPSAIQGLAAFSLLIRNVYETGPLIPVNSKKREKRS